MRKKEEKEYNETYHLTKHEIDLISEALKNHINLYKGWILVHETDKEGETKNMKIAYLKTKIRELEALQEKTSYIGQAEMYK